MFHLSRHTYKTIMTIISTWDTYVRRILALPRLRTQSSETEARFRSAVSRNRIFEPSAFDWSMEISAAFVRTSVKGTNASSAVPVE